MSDSETDNSITRIFPATYLIDKILPCDNVNFISGGSGTNKTTLIGYILSMWIKGLPLWGFKSHPSPFMYFSLDRPLSEVEPRLNCQGIQLDTENFKSFDDQKVRFANLDEHVKPEHKLIIIESIVHLFSANQDPNSTNDVNDFFKLLKRWIRSVPGRSLLFTSWDSKGRTTEGIYDNPRERTGGSVAWGGNASTVFNMQRIDETKRRLDVSPRDAAPFTKYYISHEETGALIETASPEDLSSDEFYLTLLRTPVGRELDARVIQSMAETYQLSERTWRRKLSQLVKSGTFKNIAEPGYHGLYVRTENSPS